MRQQHEYFFTPEEINSMEHELRLSLEKILVLEDEKRNYDGKKNAAIKALKDPMYEMLRKVTTGSEMRFDEDKQEPIFKSEPEVKSPATTKYACSDCGTEFFEEDIEFTGDDEWTCPHCYKTQVMPETEESLPPEAEPGSDQEPESIMEAEPGSVQEVESPAEAENEPVTDVSPEAAVETITDPEIPQEAEETEDKPKPQPNIRDISDLSDLELTGMNEEDRIDLEKAEKNIDTDPKGVEKILARIQGKRKDVPKTDEKLTQTVHSPDGKVEKVKEFSVVHSEEIPISDKLNEQQRAGIGGQSEEIDETDFEEMLT